jgi:asparagine synthase (glutamine-hydrolysing)
MCGITGFWNYRSREPAEHAVIEAMTQTLTHRGPDDAGVWVDGLAAIGMRRLKVVDLAGGHQPMGNEDGTVRVVFNGEIYNHADLRNELVSRGHQFGTRSDTEAIVHAYEEWGEECFSRFNGMFGIAVWDARRQRLLLARDRLGIKPMYVYAGPEGVVFGSELKAVIAAPWVPVEWDLEAIDDFITYEYVPAPRSIVQGVSKMVPGTAQIYDGEKGSGRTVRYWHLEHDATRVPTTMTEATEELRGRLDASVRRRLMADVPLGAFLSGGIDSSIIVALMSAERPGDVQSFSMGFADRSYNELDFARVVAERYRTKHREELVTPEIVGLAERLMDSFDEPFGDVSAFPTYMISALARREVTVVLSGDGGDELFAGYDHYRAHRWAHRLRWLTRSPAWHLPDALLRRLPPSSAKKGPVNKAKRFAEGLRRPVDLEHARWWVFWDLLERRALYSADVGSQLSGRDPFGYYRDRLAEASQYGFQGLQRQLYADVTGYLPDDILVKVDRMSMAVSLEARVPFLDHEVVEFAMALPADWKLRSGETKWLLKRAFAPDLPPQIQQRGKEGFSIPMKNWIRGPLQPLMDELLDSGSFRDRGWFEMREVQRLVAEHQSGQENHAHRLWCLMALELSVRGIERRVEERLVKVREIA